ncbi:MAG: hypothetical protein ACRYFU_21105 [Janthinobacterium lividum]
MTPGGQRTLRLFSRITLLIALLGLPSSRAWAQADASPQAGASVGERSTPMNAVPEKREQETDTNEVYRHSKAVAKLGSMVGLGAEQAATIFEVLNFLVLAIGVGYLAVKTLPKVFRERNTSIQRHLVDARTATEEASARLNSVEERLSRLDGEIAGMRTHLEAETARDEQRIRASVEEEAAKILASADSEIQAATAFARRELQRHAAELAIEYASQRLVVTAETDRQLIQGFAQRLMGDKGGQN